MGHSPSAILAYGYNLSGGDRSWDVEEVDEDRGVLVAEWFDEEDESQDFVEAAIARLNGIRGITFAHHGYRDSPEITIAAYVAEQDWDAVTSLDLGVLVSRVVLENWDAKLRAALLVLGITPTQRQPGWMLCAHGSS